MRELLHVGRSAAEPAKGNGSAPDALAMPCPSCGSDMRSHRGIRARLPAASHRLRARRQDRHVMTATPAARPMPCKSIVGLGPARCRSDSCQRDARCSQAFDASISGRTTKSGHGESAPTRPRNCMHPHRRPTDCRDRTIPIALAATARPSPGNSTRRRPLHDVCCWDATAGTRPALLASWHRPTAHACASATTRGRFRECPSACR